MLKTILLSCGICASVTQVSVAANSFSETSIKYFDLSPKDKVNLELGKQKLFGGKYREALMIFKEIAANNPTDGVILNYIGETHYKLGEFKEAEEIFLKAKNSPNVKLESLFYLGRIYMKDAKFDEALVELNSFKDKASAKKSTKKLIDELDAEVYISHCNNAKKMMANPVDVKITNAGKLINSHYDDKAPSISADGKKLVFSSRRPEVTDAPVDVEGDGKYFEDIYISNWDSAGAKWLEAHQVPGQVNQDGAHDACTSISADGKQIFIYRNNLHDPESRGGDVFVSKINNGKWKTPESLGKPINTAEWEGGACISPDGKTLFFFGERSKRNGGFGHSDIWMVTRKTKTEWDKPVNLGSEINTPFDEGGMFLAPDGKTLFFSSNGHGSMGGQDIFRTVLENGKWSTPINLGYPINTPFDDKTFTVSADAKVAYFASNRDGGIGESDIYQVDLSNYAVLEKDFKKKESTGLSILKGMIRDGYEGKGIDAAEVSVFNASGEKVGTTTTNENGEYFLTLKGGVKYTVKASKNGAVAEELVDLPLGKNGETFTLEKQLLLNKK